MSNYYPPYEVGGYEQLCRDVAYRLAERGHSVSVLTSDHGIRPEREVSDETDVYRVLKMRPDYSRWLGPAAEFFLSRRANLRFNLAQLDRVLDVFWPQIVFVWNLEGLPRELALACENAPGVATAYWLAGYSPSQPDDFWIYWQHEPANRLARLMKRPMRWLALRIMAGEGHPIRPIMRHTAVVSHYAREAGIANGTLPANAQVIYNGVEVEVFWRPVKGRAAGPLRLLQAGRVTQDKGVHTSLEAVGELVRRGRGEQVVLSIAGSGPVEYERSLRRIVTDKGIEQQVTFLGQLPRTRMPELMQGADVLLLPTPHQEPFARVMLEAMAAGLTVVGTTTGGTGELLCHEVNGLAFETGNGRELASRLEQLINDDVLRQRLARRGQEQVVKQFNLDLMVDNLETFLTNALTDGGGTQ